MAGIIERTKQEFQLLDRKKRNVLTTYCAHHPKADVNRLYIKRRRESFRLINVEVNVGMEMI